MSTEAVMEGSPELLRWIDGSGKFTVVDNHYRNLISAAIAANLRAVRDADGELAARAQTALCGASDAALLRVIAAPDTSFHLMWEQPRSPTATLEFLCNSLLAENALEGAAGAPEEESWTALGDALVLPTGEVALRAPSVDPIPLDLDSPRVRIVDPVGMNHDHPVWEPLDMSHRDAVVARLQDAYRRIERTNAFTSVFCRTFLKVIVIQQDRNGQFVSAYSTQQYPGRAVLSNPQFIDVVQAAESIVHEAIHAFLYMLSQTYPWGICDPKYDDRPKVASPWTGKLLPVSTFLHACFVWYGLLNFWSHALLAGTFSARRVRGRMSRAARGFLGGSLLDMIDEADRALVFAPVRRAIDRMQDRVRSSSADRASAGMTASAQ